MDYADMNIDQNDMRMNMNGNDEEKQRMQRNKRMKSGRMGMNNSNAHQQELEQIYSEIDERMCMALAFHEQLADYFCFLGLQGFKRMAEYQYMKECAEKRKVHKRYIDYHHKVIPVKDYKKPVMIPKEWGRYTTHDIDDSVVPKYVRIALEEWYNWEMETKECFSELCEKLMSIGQHTDYEFLKEMILDVEKECKKITRMIEQLNGTGYDTTTIHGMQDKYHEKYKRKYDDRFTTKNNYVPYPVDIPKRDTKRRMGFE